MTVGVSTLLGRPLWYELMTTDTKAAETFYRTVVGWTSAAFEGSPRHRRTPPGSRVGCHVPVQRRDAPLQ
jgi:predicted enzyme related to lactoylglutathione lyase